MRRALLILLPLLFVACTKEPTRPPLPSGEQTFTGILFSAPYDLLRRGTHVLRQNDRNLYYVESATVNLRAFENKSIDITGILEQNSDPSFLPVLVARSVKPVTEETQDVTLSSLGLRCTVPSTWKKSEQSGVAQFIPEGSAAPIVTLRKEKDAALPSGTPFTIAGRAGVRTVNAVTRAETVFLLDDGSLLSIAFLPDLEKLTDELRSQWSTFLDSIRFSSSSSSMKSQPSSADIGTPCGGPAGILCLTGEYCAITDPKENIGHCTKAK